MGYRSNAAVTPADVDAIVGVTFPELKAAVEKVALLMGVEMRKIEPGEVQPATTPAA